MDIVEEDAQEEVEDEVDDDQEEEAGESGDDWVVMTPALHALEENNEGMTLDVEEVGPNVIL